MIVVVATNTDPTAAVSLSFQNLYHHYHRHHRSNIVVICTVLLLLQLVQQVTVVVPIQPTGTTISFGTTPSTDHASIATKGTRTTAAAAVRTVSAFRLQTPLTTIIAATTRRSISSRIPIRTASSSSSSLRSSFLAFTRKNDSWLSHLSRSRSSSTGRRRCISTSSSMTSSSTSSPPTDSTTTPTITTLAPPVADRDEVNGYVYAGVAPPNWDMDIPRQDEKSSLQQSRMMMDPPVRIADPYHWMRDDARTNPKVLQHLQKENDYTHQVTRHLTTTTTTTNSTTGSSDNSNSIVTTLYNEMISKIQESDYSTPRPNQDYLYYTRTIEGLSYKLYCRSRLNISVEDTASLSPPKLLWPQPGEEKTMTNEERKHTPVYSNEQVLLNVNALAIQQSYCAIGMTQISPSQQYYAYTVDYTGDEICTLCILDVSSPSLVSPRTSTATTAAAAAAAVDTAATTTTPVIHDGPVAATVDTTAVVVVHENTVKDFPISGMIEWGHTDATIYYTTLDSAQRPYQVYCRTFETATTMTNQNDDLNDCLGDGKVQSTTQQAASTKQTINFQKYTDTLLYEDLNDAHYVSIYKSHDSQYLFIESSSKETTEIHYLSLFANHSNNKQESEETVLHCIATRRPKVLYEVDHYNGYWWITSNVNTTLPNMALYTAPAIPHCESLWTLVVQNHDNNSNDNNNTTGSSINTPLFDGNIQISLEGITCFQNHIVAYGRQYGLPQIWIIGEVGFVPLLSKTNESTATATTTTTTAVVNQFKRLVFDEDAYDVTLGTNYEYNTSKIVVMYDSMITPTQAIEIDMYSDVTTMMNPANRTIIKQTTVPGYDKTLYQCERKMVLSRDGTTQIPISMVYRKDVMESHLATKNPVPVHLYGYGSYGASMESDFVATRLPLLQRNMIYIVAHVRGGSEMGRHWYEEPNGGKYLCKMNTFFDFVDVARFLIDDAQLTTANLMSCEGRSAGGLLIGASINLAPELFKVAILGVPFVDVVPTMIDASIPLTAGEWEEWGNPNEIKFFDYMMKYSPTFNVKVGAKYPACLLTGGLHDPRVQYWEPAKFAAALRFGQQHQNGDTATVTEETVGGNSDTTEDDARRHRPICLKIDMSAGHFSASDRYKYYKEKAFDYAFLLDQLGLV